MTSDVRYEIKNFVTCYLTWKFDLKNPCSVRTQTKRNNKQLILVPVDPVDDEDEDPGPQTSGPPTDNVRSKEMEEY